MSALSVALIGCGSCAGQDFLSLVMPAGIKVVQYTDGFDFLSSELTFSFKMYFLTDVEGAIGVSNILDVIVRKNCHAIAFSLGGDECLNGAFLSQIYPSYLTLRAEDVVAYILSVGQKAVIDTGEWSLCKNPPRLVSPSGKPVVLNGSDYSILEGFLDAAGVIRSCEDIALRLGSGAFDGGAIRVYQKIFRLRRKVVKQTQTSLPLLTIQGCGYIFHGRLIAIATMHRDGVSKE